MTASDIDTGFFDSELSLGDLGDRIFLETRHRIQTGVYRPGQLIKLKNFAKSFQLSDQLAFQVTQALSDHGYLVDWQLESARIISWSDDEIVDFLTTLREMAEFMLSKVSERNDEDMLSMLRKAIDIDLSGELTADVCEAFQIRAWMYWHTILYSTEVRNFRKILLSAVPPVLRRRLIYSIGHAGMRSLQSYMKGLIKAIEQQDKKQISLLATHQWEKWVPAMVLQNSRYQSLANDGEINYNDSSLPEQPVFTPYGEPGTPMQVGFREPLNWKDFEAMVIK
ncbi:MAG: hypothetical protein HC843_04455 [Sphingomonadales bacterium]|nr:hypothetical protein [Sphingomonadales bacterium]